MKYLIDTHIFIWSLVDPDKISNSTKEIMRKAECVLISNISFWEISLKFSLGKLKLNKILPEELPTVAIDSGFEILDIDAKIMASYYKLPKLEHKDPFDRIIIWSAIQHDLTLISRDNSFEKYLGHGLKIINA